ncbi:MAG TPA: IclR family transcriptional regulator [Humibacter sp.]|nr:IclR family transcriptional regulator [Humibacter sp.]
MSALPVHPTAGDTPAPAAFRAVQVLEFLGSRTEPSTLTDIASALGLAKSSASNLVTTLDAARMVRKSGVGWVLGYKVLELGQSMLASTTLVTEFQRIANVLPALQNDTALLAALDDMEVIYLARHDGRQPIRLASDIGRRMPASVTALGKAMLAGLSDSDLDARLARVTTLPRPTKRAHRTVADLRRDLEKVRARGYAIDDEQNTIGVTCFAVSVAGGGQPIAVSTTLLTQRVRPDLRDRLVADLTSLARQLSTFANG